MHRGTIKLAGHPESFQLEKQGWRVFVNIPDAKQIAVVDTTKDSMTTWPMQNFQANFPMALDEPNHRLFVGCRKPARLVIFDTEAGKPVADLAISGDTDDLFYDAARGRVYIIGGQGFIDVLQQKDPDHYDRITRYPVPPGTRTGLFVPELGTLFAAVPHRDAQGSEILAYEAK